MKSTFANWSLNTKILLIVAMLAAVLLMPRDRHRAAADEATIG